MTQLDDYVTEILDKWYEKDKKSYDVCWGEDATLNSMLDKCKIQYPEIYQYLQTLILQEQIKKAEYPKKWEKIQKTFSLIVKKLDKNQQNNTSNTNNKTIEHEKVVTIGIWNNKVEALTRQAILESEGINNSIFYPRAPESSWTGVKLQVTESDAEKAIEAIKTSGLFCPKCQSILIETSNFKKTPQKQICNNCGYKWIEEENAPRT